MRTGGGGGVAIYLLHYRYLCINEWGNCTKQADVCTCVRANLACGAAFRVAQFAYLLLIIYMGQGASERRDTWYGRILTRRRSGERAWRCRKSTRVRAGVCMRVQTYVPARVGTGDEARTLSSVFRVVGWSLCVNIFVLRWWYFECILKLHGQRCFWMRTKRSERILSKSSINEIIRRK